MSQPDPAEDPLTIFKSYKEEKKKSPTEPKKDVDGPLMLKPEEEGEKKKKSSVEQSADEGAATAERRLENMEGKRKSLVEPKKATEDPPKPVEARKRKSSVDRKKISVEAQKPLEEGEKRKEDPKKTVATDDKINEKRPAEKLEELRAKPKGKGIGSGSGPPFLLTGDEEAVDKEDEKILGGLEGYHGYLPRDDLFLILKNLGDYLLRISQTEEEENNASKGTMHQIILSIMLKKTASQQIESQDLIKNLIIRKKKGQFYISPRRKFLTVNEVIDCYKMRPLKFGKGDLTVLKTPIPHQKWEFKHQDVKLSGKELGKGEFGIVQLGELTTKKNQIVPVAIKSTKGEVELTKDKIRELMREARLVRFFKCPNVVRTYGVAVDDQPLYIILEYVDGGSLKSFLINNKEIRGEDRLAMTLGAARGLQYLHKMDIVHCDVAARNCLVTTRKMVKLADFGLSTTLKAGEIHSKAEAKMKLPIKWLAPETIQEIVFSHKSDVYSFGILSYEICTGTEPYAALVNRDAKQQIKEGKPPEFRPPFPIALQNYYKEKIFAKSPGERATMMEVICALVTAGAKDIESKK